MSQYPPSPPNPPGPPFPPTPPSGYPQPPYQPQYAPAIQYATPHGRSSACRAAATMQIVLGALVLLLAFCMGAALAVVASGAVPLEQQAELTDLTAQMGISVSSFLLIASICMGVPGLLFLILGIFIWRESMAAIITSLIIAGGVLLLYLVGTAYELATRPQQTSICANSVSIILMGVLVSLDIWAIKDVHLRRSAAQRLYTQWQQYYAAQQQQQQPDLQQPPPAPPGDTQLPPPRVPPAQ